MNKKGLALGFVVTALFLGGCSDDLATSPFEEPTTSATQQYDSDAVVDGKFLDEIKSTGALSPVFSDEDAIRYAKSICTLLDASDDAKSIVEDFHGTNQRVGDAAIEYYCPHHLE